MMKLFYVVSSSLDAEGGISRYELTAENKLRKVDFTPLAGCNWVAFSPDRRFLYATCIADGVGAVAAFTAGPQGELAPAGKILSSQGISNCYVEVSPDGNFLYATNYSSGSIAVYSVKDGIPQEMTEFVEHTGCGPNKKRQQSAHPHCARITPDGKFVTVIDLGKDQLISYPQDARKGLDKTHPVISQITPGGNGPRHLAYTKDGKYAYVLNEVGNTVMLTRYRDGKYVVYQTVSTLPAGFSGQTKASAIRLSDDEKYLYASNRGYDSIVRFRTLPDHTLTDPAWVSSQGESPRDFNYVGGQNFMLITNEFTDNMILCRVNADGTLSPLEEYAIRHPLCVLNV